jgi:hypothetical protein
VSFALFARNSHGKFDLSGRHLGATLLGIPDYESGGQEFESLLARQLPIDSTSYFLSPKLVLQGSRFEIATISPQRDGPTELVAAIAGENYARLIHLRAQLFWSLGVCIGRNMGAGHDDMPGMGHMDMK